MKRKTDQNETQAAPKKKFNKAVNSSNEKLDDKAAQPTKRSKFEKPTKLKKFDKPATKNAKPTKSLVKSDKKPVDQNFAVVADGEKPNWSEFKKEKKELKEKRKAKKLLAVYERSIEAKRLGEKLRRADCSAAEREKLCDRLDELLKGNLNKAIFSHDMSRVVQWLIKYCNSDVRRSIVSELKPSLVLMFQSKYANNCIKKAMKHGTDEIRKDIISSLYGHVVKLVSHGVSSSLVDYAYTNYATDIDKMNFKQEFYGDMYKQAKDKDIRCISDVFTKCSNMKAATLSAVKINLGRALTKKLVTSAVVQDVLVDYLQVCSVEDRAEMIVSLTSSIGELSRTENGAKIATICIWHGTTKDRKSCLKAIKQCVKDIAVSEHGHVVLMAMFDTIDDTVLMKKLIFPEILSQLVDIATNEYGRRVILYLVARRDGQYFHPALVQHLKQGDDNQTSKKSTELREHELLEIIMEPLLDSVTLDVDRWLANGSIAMVTLAILKRGQGDKLADALRAIARFITDPRSNVKSEDGQNNIAAVEHPGLHMMLKKLLVTDKSFDEKKLPTFGSFVVDNLNDEVIERWIQFNRGCFLLIVLLENAVENVVQSLKSKMQTVAKLLKTKKGPGAAILLKKIQ